MRSTTTYNGIVYSLNKTEKTASVIGNKSITDKIFIPRSINFNSTEYIVTSISTSAFEMTKVKSIDFPEDSEMILIDRGAFTLSSIQSLSIPSKLTMLNDGWNYETSHLYKFKISPNNPVFKSYDDKLILGRSFLKNDDYDCLIFCARNVKEITIPDFVLFIYSYAFTGCNKLKKINISPNSQLKIIGNEAFSETYIETLYIPPELIEIRSGAFTFCSELQRLEIPTNSKLMRIQKDAFSNTALERLYIPQYLTDLEEGWCNSITDLISIKVNPKNLRYSCVGEKILLSKTTINDENYENIVFCARDVTMVQVPNFIKTIETYSFAFSTIKKLILSAHVTKICNSAFLSCNKLKIIEIPENSELQTIEQEAFSCCAIESLFIPSKLINLEDKWCYETEINKIDVSPKNPRYSLYDNKIIIGKSSLDIDNYDVLVFAVRNVDNVVVPNFINKINSNSFYKCMKLNSVDLHNNVKLIDSYAFAYSSINNFVAPANLDRINEYAFSSCTKLSKVFFPNNCQIKVIEKHAFSWSKIGSFFIPEKLLHLRENVFYKCKKLKIVEIDEKAKIDLDNIYIFFDCPDLIIMFPVSFLNDHWYDFTHILL